VDELSQDDSLFPHAAMKIKRPVIVAANTFSYWLPVADSRRR